MAELSVVTIDGPAGAGKSTVARIVADDLGFRFLDTGAMYRAVTLAAIESDVRPEESEALLALLAGLAIHSDHEGRVFLNDRDVTDAIRSRDVTKNVSAFAALLPVRRLMSRCQRTMGEEGRLVCEGRDMGTFVFPDAAARIYLDASAEVRAERRAAQLKQSGSPVDFDTILNEIKARDAADSKREAAPLKRVPEQHYIDSSRMSRDEVVAAILDYARQKIVA